jgi:pre-mRNA-splicing factor SPF27
MPLINAIHESLPYIDNEPTADERTAATALINSELSSTTEPHPSLPSLQRTNFSSLIESELERVSSSNPPQPLKAIDLSRYESLSPSPSASTGELETLLSQAYTSQTYLNHRLTNLSLLDQFGKNSWLIGNAQLEDILKSLEKEVAQTKDDIDQVVIARKQRQDEVEAEIKGLEEGWKKGVGRVLETEVAAEGVRREILEKRREGAR